MGDSKETQQGNQNGIERGLRGHRVGDRARLFEKVRLVKSQGGLYDPSPSGDVAGHIDVVHRVVREIPVAGQRIEDKQDDIGGYAKDQ